LWGAAPVLGGRHLAAATVQRECSGRAGEAEDWGSTARPGATLFDLRL
jgi:hypothetical protein